MTVPLCSNAAPPKLTGAGSCGKIMLKIFERSDSHA